MIIVKHSRQIRTSRDIRGFHACLYATGLSVKRRTFGVLPALRLARAGRQLSRMYGL